MSRLERSPDGGARVLEAMSKVADAIGAVGKAQRNKEQGYSFRGIDDIIVKAAGPMHEHGLIVTPFVMKEREEQIKSRRGAEGYRVVLDVEYTFYSTEDGSSLTVRTKGEAIDYGDKAHNKAMTASFKYALVPSLHIPTDEPEADHSGHELDRTPSQPEPREYAAKPLPTFESDDDAHAAIADALGKGAAGMKEGKMGDVQERIRRLFGAMVQVGYWKNASDGTDPLHVALVRNHGAKHLSDLKRPQLDQFVEAAMEGAAKTYERTLRADADASTYTPGDGGQQGGTEFPPGEEPF